MHGEIELKKEEVLNLLSEKYPNGEYENWNICEALEPHIQILLEYQYISPNCRLKRADLLHKNACYFLIRGDFGISNSRAQEAVEIKKELLGLSNADTLNSLDLLTSVLNVQGR
jgi:hypothetical protein